MQVVEPKFEAGCYTTAPWIDLEDVLEHHYDDNGCHQLQYKGQVGAWASYSDYCFITIKDKNGEERTFYATTKAHWPRPEMGEDISIVPRY